MSASTTPATARQSDAYANLAEIARDVPVCFAASLRASAQLRHFVATGLRICCNEDKRTVDAAIDEFLRQTSLD